MKKIWVLKLLDLASGQGWQVHLWCVSGVPTVGCPTNFLSSFCFASLLHALITCRVWSVHSVWSPFSFSFFGKTWSPFSCGCRRKQTYPISLDFNSSNVRWRAPILLAVEVRPRRQKQSPDELRDRASHDLGLSGMRYQGHIEGDAIIHGRLIAAPGMVIREIVWCDVKQTWEIN
jgi:hypothetical protein